MALGSVEFANHPNVTLRVDVERIDATTMYGREPDAEWRYVDSAGHGHFYATKGPRYPTLHEVTETEVEDGDEWEAHVRWECPHCGEHIVPGSRSTGGQVTSIPGVKRYYLNDVEVPRDEFVASWHEQALAQLAQSEAAL